MKIIICTTPIRPVPTDYPPFGSMALLQSLRLEGYDPYFYDIDGRRPTFEEVVEFFKEQAPDVVGISAVVSTAYAYTKRLAQAIKEVSPETNIVVGGNLAASSEILLRFCDIDVCAIGEGERLIVRLIRYWEAHKTSQDYSQLKEIKGLAFLDEDGEMVFTGYDVAIPAAEFLDPDWNLVEQYSNIGRFVSDPMKRYDFAQDPRSYEPHRRDKKIATVITAKGCVARCTFCHRWDKGYRHWTVDKIINNIQDLIDNYNVGFLQFGDENFGSDRRKLDELLERLKPLDILYYVSGVRCRSVDPDLLRRLKESGCVAMYYGMETGSQSMLEVMEKNTSIQQNIDAARWTYEAGIYTIYQLVLAMPGETSKTIAETGDFVQKLTEFLPDPPHKRLSINYIQALPGTPVYEYARNSGLIGNSLEDEESYLLNVSDTNAVDDSKFLNFTDTDYFSAQTWRPKIVFDAEANWYKKRGWKTVLNVSHVARLNIDLPETEAEEDYQRGGYFNIGHAMLRHPVFYRSLSWRWCYPLRTAYPLAYIILKDFIKLPKKRFFGYVLEYLTVRLRSRRGLTESRSLRSIMKDRSSAPITKSEQNMLSMREGR